MGVVNGFDSLADESFVTTGWNVLYVLSGGAICYGFYKFLENKLEKERELNKVEGIENIGFAEEN